MRIDIALLTALLAPLMATALVAQATNPPATLVTPAAANNNPASNSVAIATNRITIQGVISDANNNPLSDVRVGLQTAGVVTNTDAAGRFTLSFLGGNPPVKDKKGFYEYLDLDKEGYIGQTVNVANTDFFVKPVDVKLQTNQVTVDHAEYSRRMSMGYNFPINAPGGPKFNTVSPDVSAADWSSFFAAMDARKQEYPTERVNFQAYIPQNAAKIKAIFLLSRHGSVGGRKSVDEPHLREFADRNSVALVGLLGNPVQRGFYPVSIIDEDLKRLGHLLHHPELSELPLITLGHSNGSGFAGIFPSQRPERVIAWISYHAGTAFQLQFPNLEKVLGLAMHGSIDPFLKNGQVETIENLRKNRNAPVALMMEGDVAHAPVEKDHGTTWDFIIQFSEAAMRIRLKEDGTLKPVVIEQGWLGGNYDQKLGGRQDLPIAPYDDYKGDRSIANWLPDKKFAEIWQLYGKTVPLASPAP